MPRIISFAVVAGFSALTALPLVAQAPAAAPSEAKQPAPTFVAPADKPFQGISGGPAGQVQLAGKADTRRVVCGLTVIQVDPKVDSRMLVRPKPGPTVVPKARIIEPKVCR